METIARVAIVSAIGAAGTWFVWVVARAPGPRWWKENRAGRRVPVTLGWAVAFAFVPLVRVIWIQIEDVGVRDSQVGELLGAAVVFWAGLVDDGFGGETRGLRGHLGALAAGRVTTGVVKVVAAVLAAAITVAWTPREHLWANLLALIAIAGCTNVWNGLDVAPGRALKGFLVVAVVLLVVDLRAFLLLWTGAAAAALWPDLRERGILGDSGANLLGFVAGAEIVRRLPEPWLIAAAAVVVGLNLLAETVTFSRTIRAIPPLRWFDRLGLLPDTGS